MIQKSFKFSNIQLNYKIWFSSEDGQNIMGDGKIRLLKTINEQGSLKAATNLLKISYRKAWGDIKKAENILGFQLINKLRGGPDGGSSSLTEEGQRLIISYDIFQKELNKFIGIASESFINKLNKK